jgi:hypothetical protein
MILPRRQVLALTSALARHTTSWPGVVDLAQEGYCGASFRGLRNSAGNMLGFGVVVNPEERLAGLFKRIFRHWIPPF